MVPTARTVTHKRATDSDVSFHITIDLKFAFKISKRKNISNDEINPSIIIEDPFLVITRNTKGRQIAFRNGSSLRSHPLCVLMLSLNKVNNKFKEFDKRFKEEDCIFCFGLLFLTKHHYQKQNP